MDKLRGRTVGVFIFRSLEHLTSRIFTFSGGLVGVDNGIAIYTFERFHGVPPVIGLGEQRCEGRSSTSVLGLRQWRQSLLSQILL